jgi:hypothetical protein
MNVEEKLIEICSKNRIPSCHSDFQISNFIIGKETSNVGKQWQCLRELQARKESFRLVQLEIEDVKDNIELAQIDLAEADEEIKNKNITEIERSRLEIKKRKQVRQIQRLENGLEELKIKKQDIENETMMFINIFENITKSTGFLEYNDPAAQNEYWNKKFETELNLNSVMNLPIGSELIKSILALPEMSTVRKKVLDALTNINKKLLEQSN